MRFLSFKTIRFFLPGVLLILAGAGCVSTSAGSGGPDGGVFRLQANQWKQMKTLNLETQLGSIADVSTLTARFDAQDDHVMYVGTVNNGLMYTLNGGEAWRSASGVSFGAVSAVAVDPHDKCTVYAAHVNQIFKTTDCLRDWSVAVSDARTTVNFTALAIDSQQPATIYAGNTAGDVLRSDNGGSSWRSLTRVTGFRITDLEIDPRTSSTIYAGTNGSGVLKSLDGGATWQVLYTPLQAFDGARGVTQLVLDPNAAGRIYEVSRYGLLRSDDGAATWKSMSLVSAPGAVTIRAFAVNPVNSNSLVYATDNAIVFSSDGGTTWSSKALPTTRGVSFLMYDHEATQSLYLGTISRS